MFIASFYRVGTLCVLLLAAEWNYVCCSGSSENDTASPYFLFMKTLRDHLSTTEIILPKTQSVRSSTEGSLIATSIETKSSRGKGYSTKGFVIEETNELQLEFTISAESGQDKFPEVELWIFPDKRNVQTDNEKIILYEAVASVAALNRPRTDPGRAVWDTREDCVQINLTQLSNKIYNKFNRSSINESHVNLTLKIQTVLTNLAVHSREGERSSHHKFCTALVERATNKSFLFIKNYDETGNPIARSIRKRRSSQGSVNDVPTEDTATKDTVTKDTATEDTATKDTATEDTATKDTATEDTATEDTATEESCHRKSLEVDLADVYGTFVKGPRLVDIGDCYGECITSVKNSRLFSHHSIIKERLKLLSERREILNYTPRCMPTKFEPLRAHFSLENKSHVIVQLPDLVVSQCGCR